MVGRPLQHRCLPIAIDMARPEILLEQYLENVSWETMEQYPAFIQRLIRGKSGVYALYDGKRLYYVGLATDLMGRLKGHLRDRHKGLWNRFSVYLTARSEQSHIRELEALLLRIVQPRGNRVSGRLGAATNLSGALMVEMAAHDKARRAELLGSAAAKRLRQRRTRRTEAPVDTRGKAGALDAQLVPIRSTYKGGVYSAVLRPDGRVKFRRVVYSSLGAAAEAIARRRVNGRWFWRVEVNGEWVRLRNVNGNAPRGTRRARRV